ncbi:hypothetical protein ACKWTF_016157 [Chironomus riparius]
MSSEDNNSIENDIEEVNHPYGKPETIATFLNEGINANYKKLLQMFLNDEVKNRKIVVLSIVGAFRRGKSFFLNYCLRYLYANYKSINYPENSPINSKNWMGDQNEPLIGFSSRPGITRDTTGMIFWDDIFLYNNEKTGEKLAIVVMDTQGLFDNDTSTQDNSRIFALSTLISSIQILNLTGVIQEDQLQYLQFATEFAKFATMNSSFGKAFQKLIFLIRDWDNCSEHDYGFKGGMQYLNSILETKQNQNDELKSIRQFIKESFSDLSCFLHPDPGDRVANRRKYKTDYNGNWGEMSEDFRSQLIQLIENILRPENLIVKKFAENDLKGQDFYEYIEDYFNLFQSDNLPQAQTIYQSAIEKYMKKIIDQCVARYKEIVYSNHDILTNVDQIPVLHKLGKDQALIEYEDSKKMGDLILQDKYRNTLDQQIDKICQNEWGNQSEKNVKKINEEKEKTKLIMEEKKKLEIEHKENERKNVEYIKELRRIDHEKQREFEKTIKEQELEQINLLAEQEVIRQEKLKELEQLNAQKKIDKEKFECEKALAEENHKAEIKRIQQEKEFETKMIQEERKLQKEEHEKAMAVAEANVANERAELEKLKAQDKANKEIIAKLKVENEKDKYQHYYEKEKNQMLYTSESIYNLFNIDNAIITGQDSDGNDIYVGRALHNEHFYPAKIISSTNKKMCSIAFNGQEIEKKRFGVLSGAHEWKTFKDGIPERATSVGKNEKNESMYIGRSMHNGYYIPGTIVKGTNYISIPYCGSEIKKEEYEFLLWK